MNSSSSSTSATTVTGKRARSEIEPSPSTTATTPPKRGSKGYKRIANTYISRPPQRKIDPNSKAKGLRHFSMKVMQKVQEKVQTTYNEVADELVDEFMKERLVEHANEKNNNDKNNDKGATSSSSSTTNSNSNNNNNGNGKDKAAGDNFTLQSKRKKKDPSGYDEKNIRRRVYDALNVLMAMGIILKDRKDITWQGLPDVKHNAAHELETLQRNRDILEQKIQDKREYLRELIEQHVCYRNLALSNKYAEQRGRAGAMGGMGSINAEECIPLPFIVVSSDQNAKIGVKGSSDWNDVMLDFSHPFEVNDDSEVLKRIGYGKTNWSQLSSMLPAELLFYCQQHELLDHLVDEPPYQDPCEDEGEQQTLASSSSYDHNNGNSSQSARRLQYLTQSIQREESNNEMGGYYPMYANTPKTPDKHSTSSSTATSKK